MYFNAYLIYPFNPFEEAERNLRDKLQTSLKKTYSR